MKRWIYSILLLLSWTTAQRLYAQGAALLHQGQIEFEKRINGFRILDEFYSQNKDPSVLAFVNQYKGRNSQFITSYFTLSFNDDESVYGPDNQNPDSGGTDVGFWTSLAGANYIVTDLRKRSFVARKKIFGEDYLVGDTIRKIQWKITGERREIAGYDCRRADAIILDSIYVVAFYTDQIVPKGGPESWRGLPGMILGVALPHEHIIWFATRVIDKVPAPISTPTAGKKTEITTKMLSDMLHANVNIQGAGGWGRYELIMLLL